MEKSITTAEWAQLLAVLRDARTEVGLSQSELAERLGKPQSFVSKFESGTRRLDLIELRLVANALQIPLLDLVRRFEEKL